MLRKYNTLEVDKVVNPCYNTHIDTKEWIMETDVRFFLSKNMYPDQIARILSRKYKQSERIMILFVEKIRNKMVDELLD
jgi:hypothetical protein